MALDRPLTASQMGELRALSTRAEITATRLTNVYHFGDFRGDPRALMERYFDAHLYLSNWGTRRVMLRLPSADLDPAALRRYCVAEAAEAWPSGAHVILSLTSDDEGADLEFDGEGWLGSILPVRAELAAGDLRALYMAWLLCLQADMLDDEAVEPPVPPDLDGLSAGLEALAEFLRLDRDLLAAAAEASRPAMPRDGADEALTRWVGGLPVEEKDALLLRAATGDAGRVAAELQGRFRQTRAGDGEGGERRTVAALRDEAERQGAERRRRRALEAAEQEDRRRREEEQAQALRLDLLAPREGAAWGEIEARIATKRASDYDAAVRLLQDLRALSARNGTLPAFSRRMAELRAAYAGRRGLLDRLKRAGL